MKRFQFRLERVLRVRETLERVAREQWARAEADAVIAETEAERRREAARSARAELADERAIGPVDTRRMLAATEVVDGLERVAGVARERANAFRQRAERERHAWRETDIDREALVRLREKRRCEWRLEREAAETAELDEVAGRRAARSSRTPSGPTLRTVDESEGLGPTGANRT